MQESADYRALQQQFSVVLQQLDAARAEAGALREQVAAAQKSQKEVLALREQQTDVGSVALLRFEADFQKREALRLTQVIEELRRELDTSRKNSVQVRTSTLSLSAIGTIAVLLNGALAYCKL